MAAPVTTRWATGEEVASDAAAWRTLAEDAIEPNVFAGPECFLPALRHLDGGRTRFLLAERDGRLAGMLPLRFSRTRWGLPITLAIHHLPYAPHGAPLIARDDAPGIASALLDALLKQCSGNASLLLPHMPAAGRLADAWSEALAASGRAAKLFASFERPMMRKNGARYLDGAMSKHRRRRLDQQFRRLREHAGDARIAITAEPDALTPALERFFTLEASGWKGRRGTAAGQEAARAAFFREAAAALAARGEARIVELALEDGPAASALLFFAQDRAWFFKTAYDESLARFSPGALLDAAVTDALDDEPAIALGDSLTTVPDPVFAALWRERLPMADWLISVGGGGSAGFALAVRLESLRREARDQAKRALGFIRTKRGLKA